MPIRYTAVFGSRNGTALGRPKDSELNKKLNRELNKERNKMQDNMTKISAAQLLLDGDFVSNQTLTISEGMIVDIYPSRDEQVAYKAEILIPSYLDVQVNGGGGVLCDHTLTPDGLATLASAHAQFGTGALLPTLITHNTSTMAHFADIIADITAEINTDAVQMGKKPATPAAAIIGAHFEGPWLATAKQGIHLAEHIRAPTDAELKIVTRPELGKVMVTLAPETVPVDLIADLVSCGVTVSLGHSNAEHDCVLAALEAGASGFTHLYNAMSGCQGRMPGMVGTALVERHTYAGIIVDHQHVDPYAVKLAWQTKGTERLCLATDAMAHVGDSNDCHPYFDTQISRHEGRLTTPSGALAGSCLDMHQAVLNMHRDIGVPLANAVTMATTTPANWLKAYEYGRIKIGAKAHLLSLHSDLSIDRML